MVTRAGPSAAAGYSLVSSGDLAGSSSYFDFGPGFRELERGGQTGSLWLLKKGRLRGIHDRG